MNKDSELLTPWIDREIIVRLVLNQWIVPAVPGTSSAKRKTAKVKGCIPNQNRLQINLMSPGYVLGVLLFNIFVENRAIMPSIRLGCKVESMARVVWKCTHESLYSGLLGTAFSVLIGLELSGPAEPSRNSVLH